MKLTLLAGTHPTYDATGWRRYDALYRGGEVFREHLPHFLPRNPQEPEEVYSARKAEAHYTGYVGPILDWFAAKLCAASLLVRAKGQAGETIDPDPFYAAWKEDVDGAGTDLIDFVRARFTAALVKGRSWWLVELPDDDGTPAATRAEWDARGLGGATLAELDNEQVLDFEVDHRGQLLWAMVHCLETPRPSPRVARGRIRETWRCYDREAVETWALEYEPNEKQPEEAVSLGRRPHGFSRVPLVRLGFVGTRAVKVRVGGRTATLSSGALEGFWLMRRLVDPQVAHFRNSAALDWSIKRTCYAMPVFKLLDENKPPTMGVGYYIQIGADEDASWIAPPTAHLDVLSRRCETLQQEVYRAANQMAQGVNNNAAAVGRSGESKQADATSTEVVLRVYGAVVREAIEQTYELLAEGRGDATTWSIEGLETFSLVDAAAVTAAATQAEALNIPSPTFRREVLYRVSEALLPGVDQATKDAIRQEIDAGVVAEVELKKVMEEDEPPAANDGEDPPESQPAAVA